MSVIEDPEPDPASVELSASTEKWYKEQMQRLVAALNIPKDALAQQSNKAAGSAYNLGNYARVGRSPYSYPSYISSLYPQLSFVNTPAISSSYNKQKAEEAVSSTKVTDIKKEWCKLPFRTRPYSSSGHILGCCVCKTKTPANMPWWKPFKIMRVDGLLKKDFPYRDIYNTARLDGYNIHPDKRDYYFAVCSEECENFIYLALLDI